jgi:hypothetical protein
VTQEAETLVEDDDDGGDDFEVEIVDDTPEADRGKPRRAEGVAPQIPEDDEIAKYSDNVQKRIKQLRYEYHEERRAKEEAARSREEAIKYAEAVQRENQRLLKTLEEGEGVLVQQAKGRLQAELDKAKRAYKEAYESGDSDALLEAQETLTSIQNEKYRYDNYQPAKRQSQVQAAPPTEPAPTVRPPDPAALEWAENNQWFGKNEGMTGYAYGIHERMVKAGVDPRSKAYYDQLDAAMRERFPEEFDDGTVEVNTQPVRQSGNVVAPASRSSRKPRTVTLTPSAAGIAKRLGLTNEQYAAQMLKDSRNA